MDNVKTGELIRELRKEMGMTQKDLADRLHLTDRAVSKWERGLSAPDLATLEPLAEALGVTVSELIAGERKWGEESAEVAAARDVENVIRYSKFEIAQKIRAERRRYLAVGLAVLVLIAAAVALLWWKGFFYVVDRVKSPDGKITVTVYNRDVVLERLRQDDAVTLIETGARESRSVYHGEYQKYNGCWWAPDSKKYVLELETEDGPWLILKNLETNSCSNLRAYLSMSEAAAELAGYGLKDADDRFRHEISYQFLQWSRDSRSILVSYSFEDVARNWHEGYFWYHLGDGSVSDTWEIR